MSGHAIFYGVTALGALSMFGGIALIVAGSIGLNDTDGSSANISWALLWTGVSLELLGSSLFAIARRLHWQQYIRARCEHAAAAAAASASVQYIAPPATHLFNIQAYPEQYRPSTLPSTPGAFSGSPHGVPTGYNYALPPMSHAPPPYEPPKREATV